MVTKSKVVKRVKRTSKTKKGVKKSMKKRTENVARKVIVYSTPTCPYCKLAKQFLSEHKIRYVDVDVSSNRQKALEMINKSGQMGVPVIDINGEIIIGFDRGSLIKALNL